MKKIPLTQGKFAIVDDEDFERLSNHKWHSHRHGALWYAGRNVCVSGHWLYLHMHRDILNLQKGDGIMVDHINRNGLDNQKSNLRITNKSINSLNRKKHINSIYRGIFWNEQKRRWVAQIGVRGKKVHCGYYLDPVSAAVAYDVASVKYFGLDAVLNFPEVL